MPSANVATATGLSAPVLAYCEEHGLTQYLERAIRLAEASFLPDHPPRVELEVDPETGDEVLVIDVQTAATVARAVERKAAYTRGWVEAVPPGPRGKIRLVYDIVD